MRRFAFLFIILLLGCDKAETNPQNKKRYKSYTIVYDEPGRKEVYHGEFMYNQKGLLVAENQHDTTYLPNANQIIPIVSTISYEYDARDFLTARRQSTVSIQLTANTLTKYVYADDRLAQEILGNRVIEYQYTTEGKLKSTTTVSLDSGAKTVLDYTDEIPLLLEKGGNSAYVLRQDNETTYINEQLLATHFERTAGGQIVFSQEFSYADGGKPQDLLPTFKGFPKIKSFSYRKGIEKETLTYQLIDGIKTLTDEKRLHASFDSEGDLILNSGFENLNLETEKPRLRNITYSYVYEYF